MITTAWPVISATLSDLEPGSGVQPLSTTITGTVMAETRYLPYGEERWASGGAVSDYTYTGQREAGFRLMDYNCKI